MAWHFKANGTLAAAGGWWRFFAERRPVPKLPPTYSTVMAFATWRQAQKKITSTKKERNKSIQKSLFSYKDTVYLKKKREKPLGAGVSCQVERSSRKSV